MTSKTLQTWGSSKHSASIPGGRISLSTGARLDSPVGEPCDGMYLKVHETTWGKTVRASDGDGGVVVHFTEPIARELRDFLNEFIDGQTPTEPKEPTVTSTTFSTGVQNKVWDHLTSGQGDTMLRTKALQLLSQAGFFGKYYGDGHEEAAFNWVRDLLDGPDFNEFCNDGKQRLLDAVRPEQPSRDVLVLTVRVPVKAGRYDTGYNPRSDSFNSYDSSMSEYVAPHVESILQEKASNLHDQVDDTYFQTDLTRDITVQAQGCEAVK